MLSTFFVKYPPVPNGAPQDGDLLQDLDSAFFDAPAVGSRAPFFGEDNPSLEFHLHQPISDEPVVQASFVVDQKNGEQISLDAVESSSGLNTQGETVSDVSAATTASLATQQSAAQVGAGSFFAGSWVWFLLVAVLAGCVAIGFLMKGRSNSRPVGGPRRQSNEAESRVKGQFRISTRYQKPKTASGTAAAARVLDSVETSANDDESLAGLKSKVQQIDLEEDRPADDEFEFDFGFPEAECDLVNKE